MDIRFTEKSGGWVKGTIDEFSFAAKVFDKPSKYGIHNGRVSKLRIWNAKDETTLNYDRGWDIRPQSSIARVTLNELVSFLEKCAKENIWEITPISNGKGAHTVREQLEMISHDSNLTPDQKKAISYGASVIAFLEGQVKDLEQQMLGMRTIEEVHQIIAAKEAGLDVEIEYHDPDNPPDPYVFKPTW